MSDEKTLETRSTSKPVTEDWALVIDPKKPGRSLVMYKGAPLAGVAGASISVEPMPGVDGKPAVVTLLTIKVATTSLACGTYDAPEEPVQQELPLGDKK